MYIPPLNAILRLLGCSRQELDGDRDIAVPAPLLRLLLQISVANSEINENGYLNDNPDIAAAAKANSIESAEMHYAGFGYFEGRLGATPDVDEAWYLKSYTDVAAAVKAGKVKSATEHFGLIGAAEGRSPSARYEAQASLWKHAFKSRLSVQ